MLPYLTLEGAETQRVEVTHPRCQSQNSAQGSVSPKLWSVDAVKVHSGANFVPGTGEVLSQNLNTISRFLSLQMHQEWAEISPRRTLEDKALCPACL